MSCKKLYQNIPSSNSAVFKTLLERLNRRELENAALILHKEKIIYLIEDIKHAVPIYYVGVVVLAYPPGSRPGHCTTQN